MSRTVTVYLHDDDTNYEEEYSDKLESGEITEKDIETIKDLVYEVELEIDLDTKQIRLIQ